MKKYKLSVEEIKLIKLYRLLDEKERYKILTLIFNIKNQNPIYKVTLHI